MYGEGIKWCGELFTVRGREEGEVWLIIDCSSGVVVQYLISMMELGFVFENDDSDRSRTPNYKLIEYQKDVYGIYLGIYISK